MKILSAGLIVLALQSATATAFAESIAILGAPLSQPPMGIFHVTREHILVTGLPSNWSAGASTCHTASLAQYPTLHFNFYDGNTSVTKLQAAGYGLVNGQYGLPITAITLCRDANNNVATVNVQIALFASVSGGFELYEVGATNTSPTQGSSFSGWSALSSGGHGLSYSAVSSVVNKVTVTH